MKPRNSRGTGPRDRPTGRTVSDPAARAVEWLRFMQREHRYFALSFGEGGSCRAAWRRSGPAASATARTRPALCRRGTPPGTGGLCGAHLDDVRHRAAGFPGGVGPVQPLHRAAAPEGDELLARSDLSRTNRPAGKAQSGSFRLGTAALGRCRYAGADRPRRAGAAGQCRGRGRVRPQARLAGEADEASRVLCPGCDDTRHRFANGGPADYPNDRLKEIQAFWPCAHQTGAIEVQDDRPVALGRFGFGFGFNFDFGRAWLIWIGIMVLAAILKAYFQK